MGPMTVRKVVGNNHDAKLIVRIVLLRLSYKDGIGSLSRQTSECLYAHTVLYAAESRNSGAFPRFIILERDCGSAITNRHMTLKSVAPPLHQRKQRPETLKDYENDTRNSTGNARGFTSDSNGWRFGIKRDTYR